jgi:hypothetical protein
VENQDRSGTGASRLFGAVAGSSLHTE